MEVNIAAKKVLIYDGLVGSLLNWLDNVVNGLHRCMLVGLNVIFSNRADKSAVDRLVG
jgi:hypothetical protein